MIRKDPDAYKFATFAEEVIVASSIQSSAILGTMPMSQLEVFIPSWCQESLTTLKEARVSEEKAGLGFKSFLNKLEQPAVEGDDRTRQSLRFALELLDLMLVSAKQQRADTGNVCYSVAKGHPRYESENSTSRSSHATELEQTVAGKGYVSHTELGLEKKNTDLHQAEVSQRIEAEAVLRLAGDTGLRLSPTVSVRTPLLF